MGRPSSDSQSTWPSATLIAILIGAAGLWTGTRFPYQDPRPSESSAIAYWHSPKQVQDIDLRLWDDPFAAVSRARRANPKHDTDLEHQISRLNEHLTPDLPHLLVIGAMVSGAPYSNDVELRRRARYAVLAGLSHQGFVPEDSDHVGYLATAANGQASTSSVIPFELLSADPARRHLDTMVTGKVLLLWLDQDAFRDHPAENFNALVRQITGNATTRSAIIGPADSDGLRAMLEPPIAAPAPTSAKAGEPALTPAPAMATASGPRLAVYSPYATARASDLVSGTPAESPTCFPPSKSESLPVGEFESKAQAAGVDVYRIVADDATVIGDICGELRRRGIEHPSEIAIVAERDTLYARSMPHYFGGCLGDAMDVGTERVDTNPGNRVRCFTYLRGLDGAIATGSVGDNNSKDSNPASNKESASSRSATSAGTPLETATGTSQFDYLRRLTNFIVAHRCGDAQTSAETGHCIKAIAVLGSDVYDKIMVLQALRRSFPYAQFFTTDLDARLLDTDVIQWSQHMIVGSSYGLSLNPALQSDIPPFRDSYQTAIYLSAMLAAEEENAKLKLNLAHWRPTPRLFEIAHSNAWDISRKTVHSGESTTKAPSGTQSRYNPLDGTQSPLGGALHPIPSQAFWIGASVSKRIGLGSVTLAWLLLGLCIALIDKADVYRFLTVHLQPGEKSASSSRSRLRDISLVLAGMLALGWPWIACWLAHGTQAPPAFSGVSLWGGIIVNVLIIWFVVVLLIRGQRLLSEDVDEQTIRFSIAKRRDELVTEGAKRSSLRWKALRGTGIPSETPVAPTSAISIENLLAPYVYAGSGLVRIRRVGAAALGIAVILAVVDFAWGVGILGSGVMRPQESLGQISWALSLCSLVAVEFLIAWIIYAMLLSALFVRELSGARISWSNDLMATLSNSLGLDDALAAQWLALDLVARRTDCVAGLIWYPSVLIILMGIAAFTVEFGPFGFATNPLTLLIDILVLAAAAAVLRDAAEQMRSSALAQVKERRLQLTGQSMPADGKVAQLEQVVDHIESLDQGGFAPYSQQPLVKAILIPLMTYGAALLAQYLHVLTP